MYDDQHQENNPSLSPILIVLPMQTRVQGKGEGGPNPAAPVARRLFPQGKGETAYPPDEKLSCVRSVGINWRECQPSPHLSSRAQHRISPGMDRHAPGTGHFCNNGMRNAVLHLK